MCDMKSFNEGIASLCARFQTAKTNLSDGVYQGYQGATNKIHQAFKITGNAVSDACHKTTHAVAKFVYENRHEIMYTGFSLTTAYLAPQLFFPTLIVTVILRIEINRYLKEFCSKNLKEDKNWMNGPQRPIMTSLDLSFAAIAAIDALALSSVFISTSIVVNALPILGGIAAGSSFAKMVMRRADNYEVEEEKKAPVSQARVDEDVDAAPPQGEPEPVLA